MVRAAFLSIVLLFSLRTDLVVSFKSDPAFVTWQVNQFNVTPLVEAADANNDGVITFQELGDLNKPLDSDNDGVVRRCEYIVGASQFIDPRFAEWMFEQEDNDKNELLFTNGTEVALNDHYDRNKDGVITKKELAEFLREQARNASLAQYMAINGPLDRTRQEYNIKLQDMIKLYTQFDANKDNITSKTEFIASLARKVTTRCQFVDYIKRFFPVSEWFLSKWFTEVDYTKDNKLDINDADPIFKNADRNNDGVVSIYEIAFWDVERLSAARWRGGIPYIYRGEDCKKLPYVGIHYMTFATDIDYDNDGFVTPQEFSRHFHEQWDRNWDGVLDYEEFEYKFVQRFEGTPEQSKLQYPYDDYNKDGIVTLDDYAYLLWDKNKDGVLEFCNEVAGDIYRVTALTWAQLHGKTIQ